jgi:hypothetical protein
MEVNCQLQAPAADCVGAWIGLTVGLDAMEMREQPLASDGDRTTISSVFQRVDQLLYRLSYVGSGPV